MTSNAVDMLHVLVAAGLTYLIGFERDLRRAGTGGRVFALIGVGAGMVGVLATHGAPAALTGALTGVGFLGAGLLFRQEEIVRGLTTAAAILATVAIGAAAGEGDLLLATVGTAIALLILEARYIPPLRLLDARRWAGRFRHEEKLPGPAGRRYGKDRGERPAGE